MELLESVKRRNFDRVKYLLENKDEELDHLATQISDCLLEHKADVNGVDENGNTTLHLILNNTVPQLNTIKHLLKKGANPNQPNKSGYTPLHSAIFVGEKWNRLQLVKILLESFADPTFPNKDGVTPIDLTRRLDTRHGNSSLQELLENYKTLFEMFVKMVWINNSQLLELLPLRFQNQVLVLAQLWIVELEFNLVSTFPIELFHLMLSTLWDEYWSLDNF